eukprot:scaffold11243_cov131-Isochrysis_galbana.AAC.1
MAACLHGPVELLAHALPSTARRHHFAEADKPLRFIRGPRPPHPLWSVPSLIVAFAVEAFAGARVAADVPLRHFLAIPNTVLIVVCLRFPIRLMLPPPLHLGVLRPSPALHPLSILILIAGARVYADVLLRHCFANPLAMPVSACPRFLIRVMLPPPLLSHLCPLRANCHVAPFELRAYALPCSHIRLSPAEMDKPLLLVLGPKPALHLWSVRNLIVAVATRRPSGRCEDLSVHPRPRDSGRCVDALLKG